VAKPPNATGPSGPPGQLPNVSPPQDLYATSDIRFVMIELGKLSVKVDRLIQDVEGQGAKIDAVRHQISFVKGALWVIGGVIAIAVAVITVYLRSVLH
jgi:uncharacterized protein YoxC